MESEKNMTLEEFNGLSQEQAKQRLLACCGSREWVNHLMEHFPFPSIEELKLQSDKAWFSLDRNDWLEAFSAHPRIGEKKTADAQALNEQSSLKEASQEIFNEFASLNEAYFRKFGFIFIVCASGKTAAEMLRLLQERIQNDEAQELHHAANEQNLITHLRIDKLIS
jgi:OHCU decarboxylase